MSKEQEKRKDSLLSMETSHLPISIIYEISLTNKEAFTLSGYSGCTTHLLLCCEGYTEAGSLTPGLLLTFLMHTRYAGTRHFPDIEHLFQLVLAHQTIFQNQLLKLTIFLQSQLCHFARLCIADMRSECSCCPQRILHHLFTVLRISPVSYTHLDVYKRQLLILLNPL